MKTDDTEARDRVALTWTTSFPDGEYNREVEVIATRDGLCVDEFRTIPWEWIEAAHKKVEQELPHCERVP